MPYVKRDCHCPRARHEHGTRAAFDRCGCRCLLCHLAAASHQQQRRSGVRHLPEGKGMIDRTGTRRRLEALHAVGWSGGALGRLLNLSVQAMFDARTLDRPIYPGTAQRIADLYDQLWDKPPPETTPSERMGAAKARNLARRNGWPPPMAWDDIDDPACRPITGPRDVGGVIDEIAVERACLGDRAARALRPAERAEAVRILTARELSAERIGELLGIEERQVCRIRANVRAAAENDDDETESAA